MSPLPGFTHRIVSGKRSSAAQEQHEERDNSVLGIHDCLKSTIPNEFSDRKVADDGQPRGIGQHRSLIGTIGPEFGHQSKVLRLTQMPVEITVNG